MKKILSLLLAAMCLLTFAACTPTVEEFNMTITCENAVIGNTPADVATAISCNGESIEPLRINWSVMGEDAMDPIDADTPFEAGKYYQAYVYFPTEKGMTRENLTVTLESETGELMYTEEIEHEDGTIGMMSLIGFDFMAEASELEIVCENAVVDNTPADVTTAISYNGEPIEPLKIYWSVMGEDAMEPIDADTPFEAGKYYQMYLYYPIGEGVKTETLAVNFTGENGEHMYVETAEADGAPAAMSLIGFDFTNVEPVGIPVEIAANNVIPGNTPADVTIAVSCNGESIEPLRIYWSVMGEDAMDPIDADTQFVGGKYYQLYLYYPVEESVTAEMVAVSFTGENGEHMYVENEPIDGVHSVMSLIGFDLTAFEDTHEHDWERDPDRKPQEATCSKQGEEYRKCAICGETQVKKTSKTEHDYDGGELISGDCIDGFNYRYTCSGCGTTKEEFKAGNGEHNWKKDPDRKSIAASCVREGIEYLKCTECGAKDSRSLQMKDHNFAYSKFIEGDCQRGIRYENKCKGCGLTEEKVMFPRVHDWESTGESYGNQYHVVNCRRCPATKNESHTTDRTGYCAVCNYYVVN